MTRGDGIFWSRPQEAQAIEIWEVASGEKRGELKGHGPIADLAFSPDNRQLASSSNDSTILIWDLHRPSRALKPSARLSEKDLDACWAALFERNAVKTDRAIWKLVRGARESVPYLRKKLRPAVKPDGTRVHKLLADLGSRNYKTRVRANANLAALGELVLAPLEQALKQDPPLETRRRLQALVEKARTAARLLGSNVHMGQWRVLEALEKTGTPEAIQFIRELANGAPGAGLTTAARAVVRRLDARAAK